MDAQIVADKGELNGECNRTACKNPGAQWYNASTEKYYCQSCASRIMSYPENKGLLTKHEKQK